MGGTGTSVGVIRAGGALAGLALAAAVHGQTTLYVDDDAPAGGDGTSWNKAYRDLQDALDTCRAEHLQGVVEIRIAEGLYTPGRGTLDRNASFDVGVNPAPTVSSGLTITLSLTLRGGFAGLKGPDPDWRDAAEHPTILSADLQHDDKPDGQNRSDNAYGVLTGRLYAMDLSVEGVTCRGANLDELSRWPHSPNWISGTTYVNSLVPRIDISECRFVDNNSVSDGSGCLSLSAGRVRVRQCVFRRNSAPVGAGGALAAWGYEECSLIDCELSDNSALKGGAVISGAWKLSISRCVLADNHAVLDGGALWTTDIARVDIDDSLMVNNSAGRAGGAVAMDSSYSTEGAAAIVGSTMVGNSADFGGALYAHAHQTSVVNSILWENTAGIAAPAVAFDGIGKLLWIARSDVQGGVSAVYGFWNDFFWDPQNLTIDPVFRDPAGPDGDPGSWMDNDYRLARGSPCIDVGDDPASSLSLSDLSGMPRRVDVPATGTSLVDLGAYELQLPGCAADFDLNGFVNGLDFDAFIAAFEAGKPSADIDWDGFITGVDFDLFVMRFQEGC